MIRGAVVLCMKTPDAHEEVRSGRTYGLIQARIIEWDMESPHPRMADARVICKEENGWVTVLLRATYPDGN